MRRSIQFHVPRTYFFSYLCNICRCIRTCACNIFESKCEFFFIHGRRDIIKNLLFDLEIRGIKRKHIIIPTLVTSASNTLAAGQQIETDASHEYPLMRHYRCNDTEAWEKEKKMHSGRETFQFLCFFCRKIAKSKTA